MFFKENRSEIKQKSLENQRYFFSKLIKEKKKYEDCCPEYIEQASQFLRKTPSDFNTYDDLNSDAYVRQRVLKVYYKINDQIKQKCILYYSSKDVAKTNRKKKISLETINHDFNGDGIKDRIEIHENIKTEDKYRKEHSYLPLKLLKGNTNENFIDWGNNIGAILDIGDNCSADGYQRIVCKDKFFTIEQVFCSDQIYVKAYVTFIYNKEEDGFFLFKYGEEYTDRQNPDQIIPDKIWSQKDFGKIQFSDVTQDVIIKLRS